MGLRKKDTQDFLFEKAGSGFYLFTFEDGRHSFLLDRDTKLCAAVEFVESFNRLRKYSAAIVRIQARGIDIQTSAS